MTNPTRPFSLFISDLHLHPEQPALTQHFLKFMQTRALDSDDLYILGDLFDTWMGDDISMPDYPQVIDALKAFTTSGKRLYIMHGNRDFLLNKAFCQATGAELLPDPIIRRIAGQDTLISHGDRYCTDDIGYQRFRKIVQNPVPQKLYYLLPLKWRTELVNYLRSGTQTHKQQKSLNIMDVNSSSIEQALQDAQVDRMIHGHTHRPAVHDDIDCDGKNYQRIVLGDWYTKSNGVVVGSLLSFIESDGLPEPNVEVF